MQQGLNDLAILNTYHNNAKVLDLNVAINESVCRTQTRRNKFGISL